MFHSDSAFATLTSQTLTHEQKLMNLAKEAENAFDVLDIPPRTRHFFETGAINDLFEGHAPYRPRYILPDYGAFVRQGSAFLRLPPPQDLDELLFSLMTLYRHVPSITNFPVYLGNLTPSSTPSWTAGATRRRAGSCASSSTIWTAPSPTPSAMPTWARRPPGRAACCWRCSPRCRTPSPTSR